jgi:hypothetical protein
MRKPRFFQRFSLERSSQWNYTSWDVPPAYGGAESKTAKSKKKSVTRELAQNSPEPEWFYTI